jgi:hypothetical protein
MELLTLVEQTLGDDPLASGIGSLERQRRLLSDLDYARERLATCGPGTGDDLQRGAAEVATTMRRRKSPVDQDSLEAGVALLDRMAQRIAGRCVPLASRDRALALIGERHRTSK